jgi:drug/metabolite transporter (DMT)-like permease
MSERGVLKPPDGDDLIEDDCRVGNDSPKAGSVAFQFAALALAWGAGFLFMKVGLEGLSPAQVVLGRLIAGAVVLCVIAVARREQPPREWAVWAHLTVVAILLCVAPFLLFAWAVGHMPSGLASIYNATTPLMTMTVALVALPEERPTRSRLAGLLAGFVGVLVVMGPWRGLGGGDGLSQVACLVATASYGVAFVYLRKFVTPRRLPPVTVACVQVGIAALISLLLMPVIAIDQVHLTPRVAASVLALGVFGSGLAYVWNTNIVAAWGAMKASTVTYLAPVVSVALGILVLAEHLRWNQPVGAVLVATGFLISQNQLTRIRVRRR